MVNEEQEQNDIPLEEELNLDLSEKGSLDDLPEIKLNPDDTRLEVTIDDAYDVKSKKYNLSLTQTSNSNTYKTAEHILFVDSGIRDFTGKFLEWGAKTCYGTIASIYRIPTITRKDYNKQLLDKRLLIENQSLSKALGEGIGFTVGGLLGVITDLGLGLYTFASTMNKDYLPLAIFAGTNIVSGAFEIGRWSKSKQENLEMITQREKELDEVEAYKDKAIREAPTEEK